MLDNSKAKPFVTLWLPQIKVSHKFSCLYCGLRLYHSLLFCNTGLISGYKSSIGIIQHVYSSSPTWPTSEKTYCTEAWSPLWTYMLHNSNSRQKCGKNIGRNIDSLGAALLVTPANHQINQDFLSVHLKPKRNLNSTYLQITFTF
jgi:hypothetical protein